MTERVLPANRVGHSVAIYKPASSGTKMLLIGGVQTIAATSSFLLNTGGTGTPLNTCYYLGYPFTAPWTPCTSGLPISLACGATALYEDTLYYFGGVQLFSFGSCQAWVYSTSLTGLPALNWKSQENMPVARYGHAAVRFQ